MKKINKIMIALVISIFFISACSPQETVDPAAIATSAVQTVEAEYTKTALSFTATPLPPTKTPAPTATSEPKPSPTLDNPIENGKACYAMTLVNETVSDGTILVGGSEFTKTWRFRNDGNCVWDPTYSFEFSHGEAMTDVTSYPLTSTVYPGDTIEVSVNMVAPVDDGVYKGYWHVKTPYGGFMGVGQYNQSPYVHIEVADDIESTPGIYQVQYEVRRTPRFGCGPNGIWYDFTAQVFSNGAGNYSYRWDRSPIDGDTPYGTTGEISFSQAGKKPLHMSWFFTMENTQGLTRYVQLVIIDEAGNERYFDRFYIEFTCDE